MAPKDHSHHRSSSDRREAAASLFAILTVKYPQLIFLRKSWLISKGLARKRALGMFLSTCTNFRMKSLRAYGICHSSQPLPKDRRKNLLTCSPIRTRRISLLGGVLPSRWLDLSIDISSGWLCVRTGMGKLPAFINHQPKTIMARWTGARSRSSGRRRSIEINFRACGVQPHGSEPSVSLDIVDCSNRVLFFVTENRFFPNVSPCGFVRGKKREKMDITET